MIRAKVVGETEVDSGNDIYGNPIKRIQYDVKQIKVHLPSKFQQVFHFNLKEEDLRHRVSFVLNFSFCVYISDVQGSKPGHRGRFHCSDVGRLWRDSGRHRQERVPDFRFVRQLFGFLF